MTENLNTLPSILERKSIKFGEKPAFREKEFGIWQSWNWRDVHEHVTNMSLGLINLGINYHGVVVTLDSSFTGKFMPITRPRPIVVRGIWAGFN